MIRKQYYFNKRQIEIVNLLNNQINENKSLISRNCILCNGDDYLHLGDTDRYGIKYYTGICKKCGLAQQYLYPNEEFIKLFYEKYYNDLYSFFENPKSRFISQFNNASYKYDIIKKYINKKFQNNLLEIGCGAGGILSFFQSKGFNCHGIDFENDHLDYARNKNIKVFSNIENIKEKFDVIILSHVIEHLISVEEIFTQCKKLLNDNGLIYIEVPSLESINKHYYSDLKNFLHIAHVTHFSEKTFMNFVKLHNFEILYLNKDIHSILKYKEQNEKIINNFADTKKILKMVKISKFFIYPFFHIKNSLKIIIKRFFKSL